MARGPYYTQVWSGWTEFRDSIVSFLLELFLRFPPQVSHQPLGGEGILWRHPITHHCIQEGLPLPGVKAQNLGEEKKRKKSK